MKSLECMHGARDECVPACMHACVLGCAGGGVPAALLLYYFIILSLSRLGSLNSINWINFCWQQVVFVIDGESSHQSHHWSGIQWCVRACGEGGVSVLYPLTYLALSLSLPPLSPPWAPTLSPHPWPTSCMQLSLILNPSNELASCTNIT